MSVVPDYVALADKMLHALPNQTITEIYLPEVHPDETRDDFGFLVLEGGAIGSFYVCLGDVLTQLRKRYADGGEVDIPVAEFMRNLAATDLTARSLGLGSFNALSQQIMLDAGYLPLPNSKPEKRQNKVDVPIGMVGYFGPVVRKMVETGQSIIVLEKRPERIEAHPLVTAATNPAALETCREIICTASVLINDTLDEILNHTTQAEYFDLIGPSSSGLPDVVFERGVTAVGGTYFPDKEKLFAQLAENESWGKAGQKYTISRKDYPGIDTLLARCKR